MFTGKLYNSDAADDQVPARFYVFDPAVGRRVAVELEMRGALVVALPLDVPEFEEPPLGEPKVHPVVPDVRRTPIDPDDFAVRVPDPAAA